MHFNDEQNVQSVVFLDSGSVLLPCVSGGFRRSNAVDTTGALWYDKDDKRGQIIAGGLP
jgi:hypothetical protein